MPTLGGETLLILASDGGIEFDHWLTTFYRRVGTSRNNNSGFDKTLPRVGAGEPANSQPARSEEQIPNRVGRLHRRNDTELNKTRDVQWIDDLCALYSPSRMG